MKKIWSSALAQSAQNTKGAYAIFYVLLAYFAVSAFSVECACFINTKSTFNEASYCICTNFSILKRRKGKMFSIMWEECPVLCDYMRNKPIN